MLVLPYIEHESLLKEYRFDEPWDGPHNRTLAGRMPKIFRFHGDPVSTDPTTNYLAVVGPDTLWPGPVPRTLGEVTDGADRTVLIVENRGAGVHWMEPRDLSLADMDLTVDSPLGVSSPYRGPAVATLDGALHRLPLALAPATLRAMLTARGGEPLAPADWQPLADGRQRQRVSPR